MKGIIETDVHVHSLALYTSVCMGGSGHRYYTSRKVSVMSMAMLMGVAQLVSRYTAVWHSALSRLHVNLNVLTYENGEIILYTTLLILS